MFKKMVMRAVAYAAIKSNPQSVTGYGFFRIKHLSNLSDLKRKTLSAKNPAFRRDLSKINVFI